MDEAEAARKTPEGSMLPTVDPKWYALSFSLSIYLFMCVCVCWFVVYALLPLTIARFGTVVHAISSLI